MKKFAAILLILLLLFNWIGYKLWIAYLQNKADQQLEARIDVNDYDESQLLEIRVALNMPYQNASTEFERQYGEIQIDGKYYRYVKRKIEDGYLILKCIPNTQKQELRNSSNDLFKINYGIDQDQNGKASSPFAKVIKGLMSDYENISFGYYGGIFFSNNNSNRSSDQILISQNFTSSPEQPPENSRLI